MPTKDQPKSTLEVGKLNLRTARSLPEFLEIISEINPANNGTLWFRGQSKVEHSLTPGVLRQTTQTTDYAGRKVKPGRVLNGGGGGVSGLDAEGMLNVFKRQARPFLEHLPTNEFEWMFIAQHHGLPTRLLDWSTNALVALFFASQYAESREGDSTDQCASFLSDGGCSGDGFVVFVIDPEMINREIHDVSEPVDVSAAPEEWSDWIDPVQKGVRSHFPICVTAPHMTSRIRAQSGAFTLHGSMIGPLDSYYPLKQHITKIFIPYTSTKAIRNSLLRVGVTESFIYPSLDTIAKDILMMESNRYAAELAKWQSDEDE